MSVPRLHLASASPRRREILTTLGLDFSYAGEDVDESRGDGEPAADMVLRLAQDKAQAAQSRYQDRAILGADTVVVLGENVLGKPLSQEDALRMLGALSGRSHEVLTGVVLLHDGIVRGSLSRSRVTFRCIDTAEAESYWQTGEPCDKAGGYAIQGFGGIFVTDLHGSHSGVIGLPVSETATLLREIGIDVLRFGQGAAG